MKSISISHLCKYNAAVLKVYTHQKVSKNGLYMSQMMHGRDTKNLHLDKDLNGILSKIKQTR